MRLNDDEKTVAAIDVLVPKIGEIIGGSQREERLEVLSDRIEAHCPPHSSIRVNHLNILTDDPYCRTNACLRAS